MMPSTEYGTRTTPGRDCRMEPAELGVPSATRNSRVGTRIARVAAGAPPEAFFVGSAIFHYLGPAFAVLLFALVEPLGVAWMRIATAAVVLGAWRRPWRRFAALD